MIDRRRLACVLVLGMVGMPLAARARWADLKPDRAAALAAELVRPKVDIIVVSGGAAIGQAAKKATRTIPIVVVSDPMFFAQRERIVDLAPKRRLPGKAAKALRLSIPTSFLDRADHVIPP
jgi:hypothetical protein